MRRIPTFFLAALMASPMSLRAAEPNPEDKGAERWNTAKANQWLNQQGWRVGCNYIPATAINQLEMWQATTFDPETIDRELAHEESLGFNSVRVFLHQLLWEQDEKGFLQRMEKFLEIAEKHKIGVMFVLFDSCWDPHPKLGKQPAPRPGLHNSGWVQSPGANVLKDETKHAALKPYVVGVISHFRDDRRVIVWDLWNEPDNTNESSYGKSEPADKPKMVLPLLVQTYAWAREAKPSQPLTSGVWQGTWSDLEKLRPIEKAQLDLSDVISFHNYGNLEQLQECVRQLRRYERPLLCTEYMARPVGSEFEPHLGWLKEQHVAGYNWGLVSGKSQTIYPWGSWKTTVDSEPKVWFHDIFRPDGSPYRKDEVAYIRRVTGKGQPRRREREEI